jgi:hypothetical protein
MRRFLSETALVSMGSIVGLARAMRPGQQFAHAEVGAGAAGEQATVADAVFKGVNDPAGHQIRDELNNTSLS